MALLFAAAVAAIEITSCVRLSSVTNATPLTLAQQLTRAQSAVPFRIHQPAWLPDSANLESVTYHTARCTSCSDVNSVTLNYRASAPTHDIELYQSDRPVSFQAGYEDSQGHMQPMHDAASDIDLGGIRVHVEVLTGTLSSGPTREVVLSWMRGGVYYRLTSRDAPGEMTTLDVVERIAENV
jgi:hypothetical protein